MYVSGEHVLTASGVPARVVCKQGAEFGKASKREAQIERESQGCFIRNAVYSGESAFPPSGLLLRILCFDVGRIRLRRRGAPKEAPNDMAEQLEELGATCIRETTPEHPAQQKAGNDATYESGTW